MVLVYLQCAFILNAANAKLRSSEEEIQVLGFHPFEAKYEASYKGTETWAMLENVAELKLPNNFTICSAISRDVIDGYGFFTLLGKNKNEPFLSAFLYDDNLEDCDFANCMSHLCYTIGGHYECVPDKVPISYPNEWVYSCIALSTYSNFAHIVWVVQGIVVENNTLETDGNQPQQLVDRMILGECKNRTNLFSRLQAQNSPICHWYVKI